MHVEPAARALPQTGCFACTMCNKKTENLEKSSAMPHTSGGQFNSSQGWIDTPILLFVQSMLTDPRVNRLPIVAFERVNVDRSQGQCWQIQGSMISCLESISILGPTDPWTYWPLDQLTFASIDPWLNQPLDLSTTGSIDPGPINPWIYRPLGFVNSWPQQPLTLELWTHWFHQTFIPLTLGSVNPWIHWPLDPSTLRSNDPWIHSPLHPSTLDLISTLGLIHMDPASYPTAMPGRCPRETINVSTISGE